MKASLALPVLLALLLAAATPSMALDSPVVPADGPIITTVDDGLDLSPELGRSVVMVDRVAIALLGLAMLAMVMLWALRRYRRDPGLAEPFHTENGPRLDNNGKPLGTV